MIAAPLDSDSVIVPHAVIYKRRDKSTPPESINMAHRVKGIARLWQVTQVEFHGQYSVSRLLEFEEFFDRSSAARVLAVALVTPLPCLVNIVAFDLIPLSSPDAGWAANWAYWTRVFGFSCISTLANIALHQRAMGLPPMNLWHTSIIVVFVSASSTFMCIGAAAAIGFPVPFLALLSGLPWMITFHACLAVVWGSFIRRNPSVIDNCKEHSRIMSIQGAMIVIYPVYYFVYQQLGPMAQGAFSLLLPVIKTGIKNMMSSRFLIHSDLRSEETVFTIEIFSALFVTFSMQNSSSLLPVILTAIDVLHACASLYVINLLATNLAHTRVA